MQQEKAEELDGSGNAFQDAAAQVFVPEGPEAAPPPAVAKQEEDDEAIPKIPLAELIDDDAANWIGKASFWPLARYVHPAWGLTDEQAEMLGPHLKPLLQEWLRDILPPSVHDYLAKNKPLGKLVIAYSVLLIIKRAEVKQAKRLEHADNLIARAKEDEKKPSETAPPVPIDKPQSASPAFRFEIPPKPEEAPAS